MGNGSDAHAELSRAWAAFAEVERQLGEATDIDVRLDLQEVKDQLRRRIAELGEELRPARTRVELETELAARERQLSELVHARINPMTQTSGDGAAPGGYGVGAAEINAAIDERYDRAGIERRIRELREALDALDRAEGSGRG